MKVTVFNLVEKFHRHVIFETTVDFTHPAHQITGKHPLMEKSFTCNLNIYLIRNPSIYECVCNVGYHGDGYTCELEINCLNQPSLCSENAQCTQTAAGLQCVCHTGFIGNGSVCTKPPTLESGFLLLSQGVATVRIPFDGKRGQPVSMSNVGIENDSVDEPN